MSTRDAGKLGAIKSAEIANLRKQKRISDWNTDPKLCKFCETSISYENRRNDFCSQSCAAKHFNISRGYVLAENKTNICLFCCSEFSVNGNSEHKYCSRKCMTSFHWQETKAELLLLGIDKSSANHIGKKYLIELHNGCCHICNNSEWMGQPIPLVLDHINGNPYDNLLTNLRVICHNCNAQTPTFAGRNKGSGRIERAKRYQIEKEILKNKPL